MRIGLVFLLAGFVLSQFYRAFLAVLAPMLTADLGVSAEALARASGLWFAAFALAQLPVGWALDRFGPRRTAAWLTLVAAGGAALFAAAQGAGGVTLAMVLLGIGCAPVLMAAFYIFGRMWPAAMFGTLAGMAMAVGAMGNLLSALPMAWAAESFGWRTTMLALAVLTLAVAGGIARWVQDPPPAPAGSGGGRLTDLLRIPALWLILPLLIVNYAPSAGIRGLWIGPYLQDVHGATSGLIGQATLVMALAMVAGSVFYGPLDRLFGTRKGVVLAGNSVGLAALVVLCALPWLGPWAGGVTGPWGATAMMAAAGLFGASFPLLIAHGRSFMPPALLGRGVTLMNLCAIGGVGVLQIATGRIHGAAIAAGAEPAAAYALIFGFFALCLAVGLALYAFSRDRTD